MTTPLIGPRFTGVFRPETAAYGFLMDVKGTNGQPPDGLPLVNGKPGGVFLATQVAEETLGKGVRLTDGKCLSFAIRPSVHPEHKDDKVEAFDVFDPMTSSVI